MSDDGAVRRRFLEDVNERLRAELVTATNTNAKLQHELTGLKADTAAHYWNAVRDENTALRTALAASREQTAAVERELDLERKALTTCEADACRVNHERVVTERARAAAEREVTKLREERAKMLKAIDGIDDYLQHRASCDYVNSWCTCDLRHWCSRMRMAFYPQDATRNIFLSSPTTPAGEACRQPIRDPRGEEFTCERPKPCPLHPQPIEAPGKGERPKVPQGTCGRWWTVNIYGFDEIMTCGRPLPCDSTHPSHPAPTIPTTEGE